ncbi:hypothetical protein L3X38_011933 [Prunus dulcis]|uniref:Uncharacterized protein n=1 Tax=Prunus dulcis TaxID=3755 RepID=A0AAD4WKT0_PRUDU|nr:hypothetical protein L3X38_011933 [Prunus dulcis]
MFCMVVNTRRNLKKDQEFEESRLHSELETSMVDSLPMNTEPQNVSNTRPSQNDIRRPPIVDPNHVLVEDVTEVTEGLVLKLNRTTLLEIQEHIQAMETSDNLNHQQMQEVSQAMAQTMDTQHAQINERFDRLLGQQNGQDRNLVAHNGVSAAGLQAKAQPNIFGVNLPQPNC